jgi:hypothetical protein
MRFAEYIHQNEEQIMNREVRIGLIVVAFIVPIVMAVIMIGIYFRARLGWSFHINERKPAVRTEMITDKVDLM